jgi:hypothetical protein
MPKGALSDVAIPVNRNSDATVATGTSTRGYVDMGAYHRISWNVNVGAIGSGSTVDAVVKQATNTSGGSLKALSVNKAITQITASNTNVQVNVDAAELDTNNSFRYATLYVTVGTATATIGDLCYGDPEKKPIGTGALPSETKY